MNINDVKNELRQKGIDFENGEDKGWSEDSFIIKGSDCKLLVYVLDDCLSYHDLFEEGEWSDIWDCEIEETETSWRGSCTTIDELLNEVNPNE